MIRRKRNELPPEQAKKRGNPLAAAGIRNTTIRWGGKCVSDGC